MKIKMMCYIFIAAVLTVSMWGQHVESSYEEQMKLNCVVPFIVTYGDNRIDAIAGCCWDRNKKNSPKKWYITGLGSSITLWNESQYKEMMSEIGKEWKAACIRSGAQPWNREWAPGDLKPPETMEPTLCDDCINGCPPGYTSTCNPSDVGCRPGSIRAICKRNKTK